MGSDFGARYPLPILAVIFGFLGLYLFGRSTQFKADGIDPSWDAAVNSRDVTEPTVVLFTAGWCPACQGLAANVLSQSQVQDELYHHYNVYTVDLTSPSPEVRKHADKMGIHSIPTLIRYDVNGQEKSRTHGGSMESVLAWLKAGE